MKNEELNYPITISFINIISQGIFMYLGSPNGVYHFLFWFFVFVLFFHIKIKTL